MNMKINNKKTIVFLVIVLFLGVLVVRDVMFKKTAEAPTTKTYEVLGNKNDLVSFSVAPGEEVSGIVQFSGALQGGYFFENNLIVNVLDSAMQKTTYGPGFTSGTSEWMTSGPVSFSFAVDFTGAPQGLYYIELHNDNASGLPEHDKSILIPVIVK